MCLVPQGGVPKTNGYQNPGLNVVVQTLTKVQESSWVGTLRPFLLPGFRHQT